MDMGLTSGALIEVVKVSPLGDPVEYRLRGYHLSLRRSEARAIEVDLIDRGIPEREIKTHSERRQPLRRCGSGQQVTIVKTRGGRNLSRRLRDLDLLPGTKLTVVSNDFPGPMIISVDDGSRLVIGKGMARHIMVEPSRN
jgi:Fe2+ transport system protein FeoA